MREPAEQAARVIAAARRPVVVTGAGMSAESGVPTFRDALTGLWSRFEPQELATPAAFRRQPDVVFGWYWERLNSTLSLLPHSGYTALVELERLLGALPIVTQNVDGFHGRAGSTDVIELHGSLRAFRCDREGHDFPIESVLALDGPDAGGLLEPPSCGICGGRIRPGVVWFGEMLPEVALRRAGRLARECDVMLLVGTSGVVYPAAGLPSLALARGATVVEINTEPTPFTGLVTIAIRSRAGDALTGISKLVSSMKVTT